MSGMAHPVATQVMNGASHDKQLELAPGTRVSQLGHSTIPALPDPPESRTANFVKSSIANSSYFLRRTSGN
jgi:hypothetical protein